MTFVVWPLPASALTQSWQMIPRPEVRQTDYEVGPKTAKQRFDQLIYTIDCQQVMDTTQFSTFAAFYATSIRHGVDKFVMPLWDGEQYFSAIARFLETYQATYFAPGFTLIAMKFEALNLPVVDDAAVWMLSQYSGIDIINWANSLHYEVHVHYPSIWVDQATIWMLQNYTTAFIISFHTQLHNEVHVHYPSVWPLPPSP